MKNKGFTLIEMLVVVAVIGILSSVLLAALGPARGKAKDARVISAMNQFRAVAESLYDGDFDAVVGTNSQIERIINEIKANNGNQAVTISHDPSTNSQRYRASTRLLYANTNYCVDSSGYAGVMQSNPPAGRCIGGETGSGSGTGNGSPS